MWKRTLLRTGLGMALGERHTVLEDTSEELWLWGTHTEARTSLKGLPPMEDPGWSRKQVRRKKQGRKRVRNQEQQQETTMYQSNLLCYPLPQPMD